MLQVIDKIFEWSVDLWNWGDPANPLPTSGETQAPIRNPQLFLPGPASGTNGSAQAPTRFWNFKPKRHSIQAVEPVKCSSFWGLPSAFIYLMFLSIAYLWINIYKDNEQVYKEKNKMNTYHSTFFMCGEGEKHISPLSFV